MTNNVFSLAHKELKHRDATVIIQYLEELIEKAKNNAIDHVAMTVILSNGNVDLFSESTDETCSLKVLGAIRMLEQDVINNYIQPSLDNSQ